MSSTLFPKEVYVITEAITLKDPTIVEALRSIFKQLGINKVLSPNLPSSNHLRNPTLQVSP